MKHSITLLTLAAVAAWAVPAMGDWDIGDPHKMHFPQLPDPTGWDVSASRWPEAPPTSLADDFLCTQSGLITDIHLWTSYEEAMGGGALIDHIELSIHEDIPAGQSGPFSMPGNTLWTWESGDLTAAAIESDYWQGWYDPVSGEWNHPDHRGYFQVNLDIPSSEAFYQEEGTTYWLSTEIIEAEVYYYAFLPVGKMGWKTSSDHWNDEAVYWDQAVNQWRKLLNPITDEPMDLAFVITPEPTTMVLLALGGLGVLSRRRMTKR